MSKLHIWHSQRVMSSHQSGRNCNRMLHDCLCGHFFHPESCWLLRSHQRKKRSKSDHYTIWLLQPVMTMCCRMSGKKLQMKDLGKLRHFPGIDFHQSDRCVKMSQENYAEKLLDRLDMQDCEPRAMTCEPKRDYTNSAKSMSNVRKYREAVGSLVRWSMCTRPDLSYVVTKLSQYLSEPTIRTWDWQT